MLKIEDYQFTLEFLGFLGKTKIATADFSFRTSLGTLFYDSGKKEVSGILAQFLKMVDATEKGDKTLIVTQYRPTSKVAKACQVAVNRGVKLVFYHTPETMLGIIGKIKNLITSIPPFGMPDQAWMIGYRNPRNCHKQMHQHAKIILANGQLLIGSHNFDENGVGLGTQELALLTNHFAIS